MTRNAHAHVLVEPGELAGTPTAAELLAILSARQLRDGQVVFAGVGIPLLAATLAQRLRCPGLTILFEGGVIGAFLTSIYVLRVVRQIFWGAKSTDPHFQDLPDAQGTEWVALVFLMCILIMFGVLPQLLLAPIDTSTVQLLMRLGVTP